MEKKRNILPILLTAIILIAIFCVILFILKEQGYLSFDKVAKTDESENTNITNNTNNSEEPTPSNTENKEETIINTNEVKNTDNETGVPSYATTNMTNEEVIDLWKKIKGNWATVKYNNDVCAGVSLEINTYVKFAKFNSDGVITYRILSFEKVDNNNYKINLVNEVNLNNIMSGSTTATYRTIKIDISKLNEKKLIVEDNGKTEYEYVSENKVIVDDTTKHQYIDSGLSQDEYCKWYKENH